MVNVPIIYFSVKWWNTLHQGASVSMTRAPSMATTMLTGMLVMALAFWMYAFAVALRAHARHHPRARARHADWVRATAGATDMNWNSLVEFFAMGGYGLYVWGSFGMCALVLAPKLWRGAAAQGAARAAAGRLDDATT